MHLVFIVLVLLLAIVVSAPLARWCRIPAPLMQILIGAALGFSILPTVALDPSVFFLLLLPPLLFLDGWRIPKEDLLRFAAPILELSVALVVANVLCVGFLIHWLLPAMPLPVAFALAAVLSPTDPVAVSGIVRRTTAPMRMKRILEGEALFNDATGLVGMRFAVAAMMTGSFSLPQTVLSFLWVAAGGLACGAALTWAILVLARLVFGREENRGAQILISLLIPFSAYLVSEALGFSGILGAVAAGVTMGLAEQSGRAMASTRVARSEVWDAVQFTAHGIVFVLLGEQAPALLATAHGASDFAGLPSVWWLLLDVMAIAAALVLLRLAWVWASLQVKMFQARVWGFVPRPRTWRYVTAMSVAGVRGAVTLAGVMTLPLMLPDGTPFPGRDLSILLAAGVIIVSLVAATILLPRLLRDVQLGSEESVEVQVERVRALAARFAVSAIEDAQHALASGKIDADRYADAAAGVMAIYRRRIEAHGNGPVEVLEGRKSDWIERRLRLAGLRAERDAVFRMTRASEVNGEAAAIVIRDIDFVESRLLRKQKPDTE